MNLHANAKTCPNSRELLARRVIEEGWSHARAGKAAGISERTAAKWVARYRAGEPMADRSSAPRQVPSRTPKQTIDAIESLRRLRMTAAEIAEALGMAISTVSRWLKRIGLGKRSRLEPPEPPNRYQRARPGELVHLDVKRLGRIQVPGHRVTGNRRVRARRKGGAVSAPPAGSSSTSASTTPPGSRSSRSCPMRRAPPPPASFAARPGSPRWESPSRR